MTTNQTANDNYKGAYVYLDEDYYNKPKEQYKYLGNTPIDHLVFLFRF